MFLNLFKNLYKIMNKTRCFLSLVAAVLLASCAARTGMPEFSVFNMSDRNEAVRVSSEGMIDDVSIVKLDNSAGAPVIGIIEDAYESENAYYTRMPTSPKTHTTSSHRRRSTSTPRTEVSSGVSARRAAVPASI